MPKFRSQKSAVKHNPLADSTAKHNSSWHDMNPKITADKKGDFR